MSIRIRRSELSTPGSNAKMIAKAANSDADLVFLDLEDAVAPSAKEEARTNIIDALNNLDWGRIVRAVRVNFKSQGLADGCDRRWIDPRRRISDSQCRRPIAAKCKFKQPSSCLHLR